MRDSILGKAGYAWSQLSNPERSAYDDICKRIVNLEAIDARDYPDLSPEDVSRVLLCIDMDHPEYFWMDGYMSRFARMVVSARSATADDDAGVVEAFDSAVDIDGDGALSLGERFNAAGSAVMLSNPELRWAIVKKLKPSLKWGRKRIAQIQEAIDERVEECRETIPAQASDYQILRACFEYVCRTTAYGIDDAQEKQDIRSVFLEGDSVCKGYAEALQYLLLSFGVPCVNVWGMVKSGEGRINVLHAWNYVKIDGAWNLVDATLGDLDLQKSPNLPQGMPDWYAPQLVDYAYMCAEPALYVPMESVPVPETGNTANYFKREGTAFTEGAESAIEDAVIRIACGREPYLCFKCLGGGGDDCGKRLVNAIGSIARQWARREGVALPGKATCLRSLRYTDVFTVWFSS